MAEEAKTRVARLKMDSVITMNSDENGIQYSADNNPKRKNSEARERFAKYEHGATVEETLEAGVTSADIHFDAAKGFINVTVAVSEAA